MLKLFYFFSLLCVFVSTCTNVVENGNFSANLDGWIIFGTGDKTIENESGNNVLHIQNTDGSNIGVYQAVTFDPPSLDVLHFSYRVRPVSLGSAVLASLDICVKFENLTAYCYMQELIANSDDIGVWTKKEAFFTPLDYVTGMSVYLIVYSDVGDVYFDDAVVCFEDTIYHVFETEYSTISMNNFGYLDSVLYGGDEILKKSESFATIYFVNGVKVSAKGMTSIGNDQFIVSFINSDIQIILELRVEKSALIILLVSVTNPNLENIHFIEFCKINLKNCKENAKWADDSNDSVLFADFFPLQEFIVCRYLGAESYGCRIDGVYDNTFGYERVGSALITAPKSSWSFSQEEFVSSHDIPYMKLDNGNWLRNKTLRESYLFSTVSENNYGELLNYTDWGEFSVFLAINPLRYGLYDRPMKFNQNLTYFYEVMDKFRERGIKIGIHTFLSRVLYDDPLYSVGNLFKGHVGFTTAPIDEKVTTFSLDSDVPISDSYQTYSPYNYFSVLKNYFAIGEELLYCDISGTSLVNCDRGVESTTASPHSSSSSVYFVPKASAAFFLDVFNKDLMEQSINSFAKVINRLETKFLYMDGYVFFPAYSGMPDIHHGAAYSRVYGGYPYLKKMEHLQYTAYGETLSSFDYYYCPRGASWDGVILKPKEFVKNYKMPLILDYSQYARKYFEFGWHKIARCRFDTLRYDYDSTTFDDVHYVMSKVFFTERSIGLQLTENLRENARLEQIMKLFGRYNRIIALDVENDVLDKNLKKKFREIETETELTDNDNFIEKKTFRNYEVWSSAQPAIYQINNTFSKQRLKMEIRPRFDFYNFNDDKHTIVTEFLSAGSFNTKKSSNEFIPTCSISDGGRLLIENTRPNNYYVEGCLIEIPGVFNLTGRRGVGFEMTGDGGGALINIRLGTPGIWGYRSFMKKVDFTGKQNFLLGDFATSYREYEELDGIEWQKFQSFDQSYTGKSWTLDYGKNLKFDLIVNLAPGTTDLVFHSIKALKEKSNELVNPTISVNKNLINFQETLQMNDENLPYLIEYDDSEKEYCVLTYNQKELYCKEFNGKCNLEEGINEIEVSSDNTNEEYSSRAEIRISAYGEEFISSFNRKKNKPKKNNSVLVVALVLIFLTIFWCFFFVSVILIVLFVFLKKRKTTEKENEEKIEMN